MEWDGAQDTGAFVNDGTYTLQATAVGIDGMGKSIVAKNIIIQSPMKLTGLNNQSGTTKIDPWSSVGVNKLTFSYALNKGNYSARSNNHS